MAYIDFTDADGQPVDGTATITLANTTFAEEVLPGTADPLSWWCVVQ